jgi:hypothetical protein
MHITAFRNVTLVALVACSLALPALAQNRVQTDIGTLDRETAETVLKKPGYSPYAG